MENARRSLFIHFEQAYVTDANWKNYNPERVWKMKKWVLRITYDDDEQVSVDSCRIYAFEYRSLKTLTLQCWTTSGRMRATRKQSRWRWTMDCSQKNITSFDRCIEEAFSLKNKIKWPNGFDEMPRCFGKVSSCEFRENTPHHRHSSDWIETPTPWGKMYHVHPYKWSFAFITLNVASTISFIWQLFDVVSYFGNYFTDEEIEREFQYISFKSEWSPQLWENLHREDFRQQCGTWSIRNLNYVLTYIAIGSDQMSR